MELQRVRRRAGYSAADMARKLGWGAHKISRLENGQRPVSAIDLANYLSRANANPEEHDDLVKLASRPNDGFRLQAHEEGLPDQIRSLIVLESNAHSITYYEPDLIPSLLQTESYIHAVLTQQGSPKASTVRRGAQARLTRQSLLNQHEQRDLTFYIREEALSSKFCDNAVMQEQALHLLIASSLPCCRMLVVPASASLEAFRLGFNVIRHDEHPPVVTVQTPTASLFLEDAAHIAPYLRFAEQLADTALGEHDSRERLSAHARELEFQDADPRPDTHLEPATREASR